MPADDLDPDWDDLRSFLRAAEARSLAGAARALRVEHTTVGRRLSALERSLGAALFARGPGGLRLTPLGVKVAPAIEEVERAVRAVRDLVRAERVRVRLAVPSGFAGFFASGLAAFRKRRADITLEIVSGARPVDLKRGEADLALRVGPVGDKDLIVRKLGDSGWSLYASPAYLARRPARAELDDLAGHEVIGYDASLAGTPAAQWIEARSKGASIVLRGREMTDMLAAALGGVGVAALSCYFGDAEPGLRRLSSAVIARREISLVYPREARLAEPVREVIRFVVALMRENALRLSGVGSQTRPRIEELKGLAGRVDLDLDLARSRRRPAAVVEVPHSRRPRREHS